MIVPGLSHWQHPRFFGYFPSNGELSSVLGDYLSTGLGVLGLSWQSSPALTELEEVVTDWMRQMVGLSDGLERRDPGHGLHAARWSRSSARASEPRGYSLARGGLQDEARPLVVYVSAHSHSSVEKAALLAGFGRANLRSIATDERYALRPDALAAAVRADRRRRDDGRAPSWPRPAPRPRRRFDPLGAIAAVAREHGLWLHVDAAMAGSAMILPECRWMWQGVEGADSLVVNAHKWLGAAFDCSLYYVRDPEHLVRVMSTNPSYLQSAVDSGQEPARLGHPPRPALPGA